MFDKTNSFYVFEYLDECKSIEEVAELLKAKPYKDISKTEEESHFCYIGPDHINDEKNFAIHPSRGIIAFTVLFQSKKVNKDLFNKELEKVLAEEYFGQKLSKFDMGLVKDNVLLSLMAKSPVTSRYADVILDQQKSRVYVRSSGDGLLFNTVRQVSGILELPSMAMRPWFTGDFIDKAQGWENAQTIFLHWLNGICQSENKYNISAGTKLDFRDRTSRIKISGDHARFSGIWDIFQVGRRIDSVQVVLKEKIPKTADTAEYFCEVLQYKLNVKKLGFYDLRFALNGFSKVRSPASLMEKVNSLEEFLSHFDSLCVAFQTSMRSFDMKDLYNKIMKLDTDENK